MKYKALKYFELTGFDGKPFFESRKIMPNTILELGKDINKSTVDILIKLGKLKESDK